MPTPTPTPTSGASLSSLLGGLTGLLGSVLAILVAVLFAALIVKAATWSAMRNGRLTQAQSTELERALLEAVYEATYEPGVRVSIGNFWRARGLRAADKWQVLRPLLRSNQLQIAWSDDRLPSTLQAISRNVFSRPPGLVILSSRVREELGRTPTISIRNGDGIVQIGTGHTASVSKRQDISPELIAALVAALRTDAATMPAAQSEQAGSIADSLESDAARGRWNAVSATVERLLSIVASGASVWASTATILSSLK